jgi:uncharacterized protein YycO
MSVTLQFCGFDSFVSRAIEYFTDPMDGIGHVDILSEAGLYLIGAQESDGLGGKPSGVQARPLDYGKTCGMKNIRYVTLQASPYETAKFHSFVNAQIGKPYDLEAIAGFVAGRDWRKTDAWFCSELAAAALETADIITPLYAPSNKITPANLLLVCSAFAPVTPC